MKHGTSRFWLISISLHLLALILLMRFVITAPELKLKAETFVIADLLPPLKSDKSEIKTEETKEQINQISEEEEVKQTLPSPTLPALELPQELQFSQSALSSPNMQFRSLSESTRQPKESSSFSPPLPFSPSPPHSQNPSLPKPETRIPASKEPPKVGKTNQIELKTAEPSDIRASAKKTPLGIGRANKSIGELPYYPGNMSASTGSSIPQFRDLMKDLAQGIAQNARQKKVDVVFIIDTTASMLDNIRGVKAYVVDFLEHLKKDGLEAALGLVKFGDLTESKIEVKGVTEDVGDFRNWLHRTDLNGGGDLAESGLDAIFSALNDLKFRKKAQKFFIFISDGPVHDADFDGQSKYSLDQIIELMKKEGIQVDVVGIDYLPIKQIAWGSGGQWRHIPGSGFLEQNPMDLPFKIYSQLGLEYSLKDKVFGDRVIVYITDKTEWVSLSWKVLDPMGQRYASGSMENKYLKSMPKSDKIEFEPKIDLKGVQLNAPTYPGIYTIIYRITDNIGNSSVLRRSIDFNQKNP